MKFVLSFLLITIACTPVLQAQSPIAPSSHVNLTSLQKNSPVLNTANKDPEICGNNIDDDGNGLTDNDDFSCYFSSPATDLCAPTKIVWATFWSRLYWVNLETNEDRVMNFPSGEFYDDITWAPNGKLYGAERFTGQIREIDPYTAQTQFVADVPGHYATNGMTTDAAGNFYLTSFTTDKKSNVVKLNITTGRADIIADLTAISLEGAGDLTFLDGFLYVACTLGKIVKIDLSTGAQQIFTITESPAGATSPTGFGLITLGDGFLYGCHEDNLYRIDPVTMVSSLYYRTPTYGFMFGLSSYSEQCHSPSCKAKVKLVKQSAGPYCFNKGVVLKAAGSGINGANEYTWTLPNGSTRAGGDTLTAFISGKYYVRYHTLPDTCGVSDSIELTVLQFPAATLGEDKFICAGSPVLLQPLNTKDIDGYRWQDGSTSAQYTARQPGIFWVESSNICGALRDSVLVSSSDIPEVDIGRDTLLCPETSLVIKNNNPKKADEVYTWSNGSFADNITIDQPGIFWLQSSSSCGTTRDSITIKSKDSCLCKPIWAAVDLGPDKQLCQGDSLTLSNSFHSNDFRYYWNDGNRQNTFVVRRPGIYWSEVATYCGTVRDTVIITEKTIDCECLVNIPSAFTPNADGKNDSFKAYSNCTVSGKMQIYNRWGNLVFLTDNLQKTWNGYYKGVLQPNDVYVYYVTYSFNNSLHSNTRKGTVVLLR